MLSSREYLRVIFCLWRNGYTEASKEKRKPNNRVIRDVMLGMRDQERRDAGMQSPSDEAAPAHRGCGSSLMRSGHCCMKVISRGVPPCLSWCGLRGARGKVPPHCHNRDSPGHALEQKDGHQKV